MANFSVSEYKNYASLQNISGSAESDAPTGGVYLFASGAAGSSKLYMQKEGATNKYEIGSAPLKVAGDSGTGEVGLGLGGTLTIAGGTGLDTTAAESGQNASITFAVDLAEMPEAALTVADDYIVFLDGGTNGATKKEQLSDVVGNMAGAGLGASSGVLAVANATNGGLTVNADDIAVNLNDLAAAAVDVANDSIAIIDANASNGSKKESIADLVGAMAGTVTATGLSDSSGVLSVDVNSLTGESTPHDDDALLVYDDDASALRKMTRAQFIEGAALDAINIDGGAIDGTAIGANSASTGKFTTLTTTGNAAVSGSLHVAGDLDVAGAINSVTITETTLEIEDKLILVASGSNSANSDGAGLQFGSHNGSDNVASILYDDGNSSIDFNIAGTTEVRIANGAILPQANNDIDLGSDSLEFKDIYIDGTAYLDAVDIDGGAIDGAAIGANDPSTIVGTNITVNTALLPDAVGGANIGSTGAEFGDVYIADDKKVQFGNDQDATIEYDADGTSELRFAGAAVTFEQNVSFDEDVTLGADYFDAVSVLAALTASEGMLVKDDKKLMFGNNADASFEYDEDDQNVLLYAGASMRFSDDVKLEFGAAGDASIEYDEDGTDQLRIAAPAAGVVIAGAAPSLTIGDADAEDTKLVFDGNAADFYMGLDDTDDKLKIGLGSAVGTTPNLILESANRNVGVQGGLQVVGDAIADSGFTGANPVMTFDGSQGVLFAAGTTTTGTSLFKGNVNFSGSSNTAPDVTFKQDGDQNGFLRWDSSENNLYLQYGSSGGNGVQVLTIGGNATSDYAIDVVNGSNNINKVRAGAFVTYSDESLKQDVSSMNTALDTVMSLEGVEFTWKDSGERDFGFIAQNVQNVLPKAVHVAEDGVQGVDYSRLTSVLVEAVKAQQVQIEELKALLKK